MFLVFTVFRSVLQAVGYSKVLDKSCQTMKQRERCHTCMNTAES
jgi:hypothetical protein